MCFSRATVSVAGCLTHSPIHRLSDTQSHFESLTSLSVAACQLSVSHPVWHHECQACTAQLTDPWELTKLLSWRSCGTLRPVSKSHTNVRRAPLSAPPYVGRCRGHEDRWCWKHLIIRSREASRATAAAPGRRAATDEHTIRSARVDRAPRAAYARSCAARSRLSSSSSVTVARHTAVPPVSRRRPPHAWPSRVAVTRDAYFHHGARLVRKSVSVHVLSTTLPESVTTCASASESGAGPRTTLPEASYWEPWHGQMNFCAFGFHGTTQPRWVQTALSA